MKCGNVWKRQKPALFSGIRKTNVARYSVGTSQECYTPSVRSQYESKLKTTATCLIFLSISLVLSGGCGSYRVISAVEVPKGYRGWVLIEQSNPKCPPAKFTLTKVIFTVNSSGHGCVSTPLPKASELLTFWEVDSEGHKYELRMGSGSNGGLIWAYSDAAASNEFVSIREATQFFVGTEAEFKVAEKTRPKWWLQNAAGSTSPDR
jgi:hypothetical protein